ncbi:unnamed protein product [Effrenium voratum]|nr:unnamed protein product [Effrenium voratum]
MTHLPDDEQALKNYVEERSLWTEMRAKLEQSEVEIQEAETIPGMPSPMKESTVKVEKEACMTPVEKKRALSPPTGSVPTFSHHDGAFQRRLCEPKRGSGNIEVPGDIFKQYMDAFLKVVTMEKSHEKTHELEEEGGFYTPEEMKELLHYKQTFGP